MTMFLHQSRLPLLSVSPYTDSKSADVQAPTPKVKAPKPAAATPTTLAAVTTPVQKKEKKRKQKDGENAPALAEPVVGAEKKVSHLDA